MKFGSGLSSERKLEKATVNAVENAVHRYMTGDPDLLMVLNAGYGVNKNLHNEVVNQIKEKYPDTLIAGSSMPGIFTDEGYAIRGVGALAFKGIDAEVVHMNRIRAGVHRKMKKLVKKVQKTQGGVNHGDQVALLFAPGYSFPKFVVNMLQKEAEGLNPFFALNLPLIKWFARPMKLFGRILSRIMDNTGLGFSYSSLFDGLEHFKKNDIKSAGCFAMDALGLEQARSWHTKGISSTGLVSVLLNSKKLKFGLAQSNGITIDRDKKINIQANIPGGFLTKINKKWGANLHLDAINCPASVFHRHSKSRFFLDAFNVICVEGAQGEIGTYVLVNNPNIKSLLCGLPHAIIDDMQYKDQMYFGIQSAHDILRNTYEGLKKAKQDSNIKDIKFGIFFDCVNRAMAVKDSFKDLHEIYKDFMDGSPFIGSMSGGELMTKGKQTQFPVLNASVVSCLAGM